MAPRGMLTQPQHHLHPTVQEAWGESADCGLGQAHANPDSHFPQTSHAACLECWLSHLHTAYRFPASLHRHDGM